jgi:hypothetical protein
VRHRLEAAVGVHREEAGAVEEVPGRGEVGHGVGRDPRPARGGRQDDRRPGGREDRERGAPRAPGGRGRLGGGRGADQYLASSSTASRTSRTCGRIASSRPGS